MMSDTAGAEVTRKSRVLVVDDEPANRRLLGDLVAREGFEVLVAAGGAEALDVLARERVDLVMLDLMMPEVDGMAVLAELRARRALPGLPVVVVTAHEDRSVRIEALAKGAIDFLTKPIDRVEVACRIRTLVELKRLRERAVAEVQDELRESNHLLRLRFAQSPVAKIAWDTDFCVTGWNPAAERLFGYTAEEAMGQRAEFIVPPAARPSVAEIWQGLLACGASESVNENISRDGRTLVCEWHNASLTQADGTLVGVSSVVLDVTERSRLQDALAQSRKMDAIGKLAGGIAHDFNNLLSVILSYAGFVREDLPEDDARREDIDEVLKAADRAAGLTKQLLTFSRQQPVTKSALDLRESLAQLRNLLARTVGEHIALTVVAPFGPAVALMDPVQFDQIVLNFAVNARDAMPDGGALRIALEPLSESIPGRPAGRWLRLTVADTGIGMDAQTRQRIFEPFFTTKAKDKGTGMGLATCFGIVADAGGTMSVESVPGQGTTFSVDLPCCDEPVTSRPVTGPLPTLPSLATRGAGAEVLVVEDEIAIQRVTARVLEAIGCTVHLASDGVEGQRQIDLLGDRLDLVLSDVVMPRGSGYDVAAYAARVAPRAAVILTSGYLDEGARSQQRGDLPILWKPVSPKDLVRAVSDALASLPPRAPALAEVPGVAQGVVLVVDDDATVRAAMARIIAGAGWSPLLAGTVAEGRRAIEAGPEPALVLCDLSLPGGSGAELLAWIEGTRPALRSRTFVMTGGAIDEAGAGVIEGGRFQALRKPILPTRLLDLLAASAARPMAAAASTTPQAPSADGPIPGLQPQQTTPPELRPERVLVVEDDPVLAQTIVRALSGAGCQVVVVGTLHGAVVTLGEGEFDALVLDITLPDGSGLDLMRDLRGAHSELPIVMMTGQPTVEAASQALRSRVHEYLAKPFPPEELVRAVRAAAEAGRVSRLRAKLLVARWGGEEFVGDIARTEKLFARALPKIRMVFQPIVRSHDGSVYGYEALLRCEEPSLASPARMLAAAEVLGRTHDVGQAVRAAVAATMRAHPDQQEAIFVNLHPTELRADILTAVTEPLLPWAHRVVLEVTDRAALDGSPQLSDELARIRAQGYRVAVDDLGEGYAGLASLVRLRPDIVKIDMSLVRDVHRSVLKQDIVAALVDLARRAGMTVVAEGVETVGERDSLVALGCHLLQGYLFARPGPPFPTPHTAFEGAVDGI